MLPHQSTTLTAAIARLRELGAVDGKCYDASGDVLVEIELSEGERERVRSTLAAVGNVEQQREGRVYGCLPRRAR